MRNGFKTIILISTFITAFAVGDNNYGTKALYQNGSIYEMNQPEEVKSIITSQNQLPANSNQEQKTLPQTIDPQHYAEPEAQHATDNETIIHEITPSVDETIKSTVPNVTPTPPPPAITENTEGKNKATGPVVLLGDSLTEGLSIYGFLPETKIIGINSLSTISAREQTENVIGLKPSKLFILIGINDIWEGGSVDDFIERYKVLINEIKVGANDCQIYVQSIFPITQSAMERNKSINNEIIKEANQKIKTMAQELGLTYVDINSALKDKNGNLNSEYSNDGVHLINNYYNIWTDILTQYMK